MALVGSKSLMPILAPESWTRECMGASGNINQRKVGVTLRKGVALAIKTVAAIAKGINVDAYLVHQVVNTIGTWRRGVDIERCRFSAFCQAPDHRGDIQL